MSNFHPHLSVAKAPYFDLEGFTLQRGMLYGRDFTGCTVATNGHFNGQFYTIYRLDMDYEWRKYRVYSVSQPQLFAMIEKAVAGRDKKGLGGVSYLSPDKLEEVRWAKDDQHRHYPNTAPFTSVKSVTCRSPLQAAKFNSIKERGMIQQRVNRVIYQGQGNVLATVI